MIGTVGFLRSCLSLAWSNLGHRWTRTVAAVAGLAFAVILIFLQLGFLGSAEASAVLIPEHLDFEVLIVSSQFVDLNRPGAVSRRRIEQAQATPGVTTAVPVYLGMLKYRNPATKAAPEKAHKRRNMMVLGVDPNEVVFRTAELPGIDALQRLLVEPDAMLYDLGSRGEFAEPDGTEDPDLGPERMRVVGTFRLGTGFGADGLAIVSDSTFGRLTQRPPDTINLGLVRIDKQSGLFPEDVKRRLETALPKDVRVWTRAEIEARQRTHWVWEMPIGIIFVFGTCVAVVVGVVFGYQVISSDVSNRLREFATLKVLGYTNSHLIAAVVLQALTLAVAAYALGVGVSSLMYTFLQGQANIPMGMNAERAILVLVASLGMCSLAAWLALGRVKTADPANLF